MRKVYIAREVGDTCDLCPERKGEDCKLFNQKLFSRTFKEYEKNQEYLRTEYQMVPECRDGAVAPPAKVTFR